MKWRQWKICASSEHDQSNNNRLTLCYNRFAHVLMMHIFVTVFIIGPSSKPEQRDDYIKSNLWVPSKPFLKVLETSNHWNEDQEKCIAFTIGRNLTTPIIGEIFINFTHANYLVRFSSKQLYLRQLFGEIFIKVTLLRPIIWWDLMRSTHEIPILWSNQIFWFGPISYGISWPPRAK